MTFPADFSVSDGNVTPTLFWWKERDQSGKRVLPITNIAVDTDSAQASALAMTIALPDVKARPLVPFQLSAAIQKVPIAGNSRRSIACPTWRNKLERH